MLPVLYDVFGGPERMLRRQFLKITSAEYHWHADVSLGTAFGATTVRSIDPNQRRLSKTFYDAPSPWVGPLLTSVPYGATGGGP